MDDKTWPVEEMIAYEEFTGRVEILRDLDKWVRDIQRMASPSTAIISPRRMGKTVLLDRLVNTVFFKPEYKVAPFYFFMKREVITLRKFLLQYATTFYRQYIAYCLQDAALYADNAINMEQLLSYPSTQRPVAMAQKGVEAFLNRYHKHDWHDAWNHWHDFIPLPERLASHSGTRVAIIIDEFQDMRFYVYDLDDASLNGIEQERIENPDLVGRNLPASFYRLAQSKKAPMLVSGSAVTMVFKTVMGGPLGGRFGFTYLKPLGLSDGATLLTRLLKLYADDAPISPENALYASSRVSGHPYYLYCLSVSACENKSFESEAAIDRVIEHEVRRGKIYGFWQTHFDDNRRYINGDDDTLLGRKIIYYFTKYNNQPVNVAEIASKLNVPAKAVEQKIEKLYLADLVYRAANKYYSFNDNLLMRYIQFVYEHDCQDVDKVSLNEQGQFNNLKGRFLEMVIELTMRKFNHERVSGRFFGRPDEVEVELPLFRAVVSKQVKGERTASYQIDLFAIQAGQPHNRYWLCESKYTQAPMNLQQIQKLEQAANAFRQEESQAGRVEPEIRLWYVSTGGFTAEAETYLKGQADSYYSDYDGINGLFQAYGGGYNLPIFKDV